MDYIQQQFIDPISELLYARVLIFLLVGVGIYFTVRTRFVQLRYFSRMVRQLRRSGDGDGVSSFQAFCVGLASRVGTGNIAGVAIALTLGGPGAIFWMWVVAAIGMATALIEATLAQIFKVRAGDGAFRGGPAFYIARGLGSRAGGAVYAVLVVITFGVAFNMVQANAISDVLKTSHAVAVEWTTVGLVVLSTPVVFGGVRAVSRVAGVVLPVVATAYVGLALMIVALNITELPRMIEQIVGGAFGIREMAGGFTGGISAGVLNGVRRGLFSNEAGMGSAPNIAATATVSHPVLQGLIQSLGVFVDTFVVCSATAFIILAAGTEVYDPAHAGLIAGATLTQSAVAASLGSWTTGLMTGLVFVFAFSAVLANYLCAEVNLFFLGGRRFATNALRMVVLAAIAFGAIAKLAVVWALADIAMGLLALVNLVAICLLGRWAVAALRDFARQADAGRVPVFVAVEADLPGILDGDIWSGEHQCPTAKAGSVAGVSGNLPFAEVVGEARGRRVLDPGGFDADRQREQHATGGRFAGLEVE